MFIKIFKIERKKSMREKNEKKTCVGLIKSWVKKPENQIINAKKKNEETRKIM